MTRSLSLAAVVIAASAVAAQAQTPPDLLYFRFDSDLGGTTPNSAVPGVGTNPAPFTGSIVAGGQFGTAYSATGVVGQGLTTGWVTDLAAGSWTIGMWIQLASSTTTLGYIFGDPASGSFRCFTGGVAGAGSLILRGTGITDTPVSGVGTAPTYVHFVYDSTVPDIKVYLNGVLANTVPQAALNMATGTGFKVGGYSTSANLIGLLDEFRLYRRALSASEIANTWGVPVPVTLQTFDAE